MYTEKKKAIALCRVSTDEQLKNNSLNRQAEAVNKIAEKYNLEIVKTWSGSVSSKAGKNLDRKDLNEMLDYCKNHKQIANVIVDEPDRFMRSMKEGFWFLVEFKKLNVKVLFSDDKLNGDDAFSSLMCGIGLFNGEVSNEERARKTKSGHEKAIRDGHYPFVPPLGYVRGRTRSVPEIDPVIGPLLKAQLLRIANGLASPTVALQDYNHSVELTGIKKAPLKMDKWRAYCTNPFLCGIIDVNKTVVAYNPNGLHEKLITKEQHERIVEVFNGKPKNQKGPNTVGNPLYPFNRMITHIDCPCNRSKYNTFVGVTAKNGQGKEYEKYRCRGCYMSISKEDITKGISNIVSSIELTPSGDKALRDALTAVFDNETGNIEEKRLRLKSQRSNMNKSADSLMDQYLVAPAGEIKTEIGNRYSAAKKRIKQYDQELEELEKTDLEELNKFVSFALSFVSNLTHNILSLPPYEMQLCKQLLFPDGFFVDENKNIYTTVLSPIYRLKGIKKDSSESSNSLVVRMKRL